MPAPYRQQGPYRNDRPDNSNILTKDVILKKIFERLEKLENRVVYRPNSQSNAPNQTTLRMPLADTVIHNEGASSVQPRESVVRPSRVIEPDTHEHRRDQRQAPQRDAPYRRVDDHRRQPRPRSTVPRSDDYNNQRRPVTEESSNPDFRLLVRAATGVGQLDQHRRNWAMMPRFLSDRVDHLVDSIRPPRPNERLIKELQDAASIFKEDVTSIVQAHLAVKKHEIFEELDKLDHRDIGLALETSDRQLRARFGKRLHLPTFQTSLDQVYNVTKRPSSPRVIEKSPPTTIVTHNRFVGLHVEDLEDEFPPLSAVYDGPKKTSHVQSSELMPAVATTTKGASPQQSAHETTATSSKVIPSSDTSTLLAAVNTHRRATASTWKTTKAEPHHTVQVVGDSNLVSWSEVKIPPEFNIDAFSGCLLTDVVDILERSTSLLASIDTVVLVVGVSDGDESSDDILAAFKNIETWRCKNKKHMSFLSVPLFDIYNTKQKDTAEVINKAAYDLFQDSYVTCCHRNQIVCRGKQHPLNGLHYTAATADIIISNMISNLN